VPTLLGAEPPGYNKPLLAYMGTHMKTTI